MDFLQSSLQIASSGLDAQSARLRVIAENIANSQSTGSTPGSAPYARKTIAFESVMNKALGASVLKVAQIGVDSTPFPTELDPGNPAADASGYVKKPNINLLIELADMRESNRAYEANLQVSKVTGDMLSMTIALLKDA